MGREAPPLRPNQITPLGRSGDRACSQPQQPRPSARSGGEGQERAVASAARVGRTHSLSRLCERVLHIGRRQRIARREAKTRNRLGRGTTSDCTGRRAAEMVRSLQVDRAAPVNLGVRLLRPRGPGRKAVWRARRQAECESTEQENRSADSRSADVAFATTAPRVSLCLGQPN